MPKPPLSRILLSSTRTPPTSFSGFTGRQEAWTKTPMSRLEIWFPPGTPVGVEPVSSAGAVVDVTLFAPIEL